MTGMTFRRLSKIAPVSYTHLDVYKRQCSSRSLRPGSLCRKTQCFPVLRCKPTRCAIGIVMASISRDTSPVPCNTCGAAIETVGK